MASHKLLEIACFNLASALIAESAGADRIELCEDYQAGGITPSNDLIVEARQKIKIPVHVMIRPRAGDFVYSEKEIEQMKNDILFCKENKLDGIVFGVLNDREINTKVCRELIDLARPLSSTFHRAIDNCKDLKASVKTLIDLGFDRVLTSGGADTAEQGLSEIKKLHEEFGKEIIIMPGGGIRSMNIRKLLDCGCKEFHSSAISYGEMADAAEIKALKLFL